MRVVVTGSSGFLGRHVAERLTHDGFEVTGVDLASPSNEQITTLQADLLDVEALVAAARGHDVICHLAGVGDVYLAADEPGLAAEANVVACANVARAAEVVGARVVYASTWEVYGPWQYEPVDEDHPCAPDHPYSITKLAGERLLLAADHLRGVPVVALRLATAYGAGLRPNSIFSIFIRRSLDGEPLVIQGDGSQGRNFTHASDIAAAFSLACQSEVHGLALNVAAPEFVTIKELAEQIVARYPVPIVFAEPRPGDVAPARIASSRASEVLGWTAQVRFNQGLKRLIDELSSED